ncbi:hypothetical protein H0H92_002682 [Tricholoma furcatifolium]|nr:hypothetical protein H0H92_002682 [Tricholoma furcatifolium]
MQAISSAEERIPFGLKSIKLRLVDPTLESGIQSFIPTLTLTFTNLRRVYLLARLEPLVEILEALPQTLPHLQDLGLQVIGTPHKFADDLCDRLQRIQLARIANNMRQLQLCVDPFPFLASQLLRSLFPCIQWSKLSYLVIIGLRIEREDISCIDYFLEILSHCASLESLSCHLFEGVHELPLPKPEADNVLRLPHLKSLSVAHWQPSLLFPWAQLKELTLDSTLLSYALWILKQTPHLELLSIDIYNRIKGSQFPTSADAGVLEVQEVQDFIRCSKASLHAFYYEVQVKPLTEKKYRSLSSLLKTLPSLQEFCAPHVVFSENILHNFILKKKWFLPNLQAVEFNVQSPAMFAQFIEERVNKGIEEKGKDMGVIIHHLGLDMMAL